MREEEVAPPPPAIINARMTPRDPVGVGQMLAVAAAGMVGALGISRLRRRNQGN
jgi:membrane protein